MLNFLVKYHSKKDFRVVSDLKRIAIKYLRSYFILDLLSTFPFRWIFYTGPSESDRNKNSLMFLFKLFRIHKLMILLDHKTFHRLVKIIFKMRLETVNRNEN